MFCSSCGKPLESGPLAPPQGRVNGHIRVLGILWIAISALRLLGAAAVIIVGNTVFANWRGHGPAPPEFVSTILSVVGLFLFIGAVAGFAAGWGLLQRTFWGRMLGLIFGAINLLDIPFGTALGIYTLWVLLPAQSETEYRQLAVAR
jgi:hypothetical protein